MMQALAREVGHEPDIVGSRACANLNLEGMANHERPLVSGHSDSSKGEVTGALAVFKEPGLGSNQMGRWTVDEHEKFL